MTAIRELFHKIGNLHNKITVGTGLARAEIKQRFKDTAMPQDMEKIINRLSELEETAVEASKELRRLKDIIYKEKGIEAGEP